MPTQSNNYELDKLAFAILEESSDMEDEALVEHLREVCGENDELLKRCLSILDMDVDDDDFRSMVFGSVEKPDESAHDLSGKIVGNYKVSKKIGSGGTAEVFLAYRHDGVHHEPVALKIIRGWGNTHELMERMKQERKILSQFQHPNITNFLDGGNAEDGRPYFVLEYVEGKPITDYCHDRRLTVEQRLELFISVCSAVFAAHSKLTLHRDLKPSNIIVTADGVPKLLDFGIAKIIDEKIEGDTNLTQFYSPMTPQYASPEQVNQQPLSVASDQYSLGVLLYELLTGILPYDTAENKILDIAGDYAVCAPSDKVLTNKNLKPLEARRLSKLLKGDLDAIVLKAISKDVDHRYSSVNEFSEDIKRYLENKTILAKKASFWYRSQLLLKRNRATVALVSIFVFAMTSLGVMLQLQIIEERDQAIVERQKFEQTQEFLVGLFRFSHPEVNREKEVTVREVLDQGVQTIQHKFERQPVVKIALLSTMARAYQDLQLTTEAFDLQSESLALQNKFLSEADANTALTLANLADLLIEKGDNRQAKIYIDQALDVYQKLENKDPKVLAYIHSVAGILAHRMGQYDVGIDHINTSLNIRQKLFRQDAPELVKTYMLLGVIYTGKGDYIQAQRFNRKALALKLQNPMKDEVTTSSIHNTMAVIYHYQERYAEALEHYKESIAIREALFGSQSSTLIVPYNNVGEAYTSMGRFDEAVKYHQLAFAILEKNNNVEKYYLAVTHNRMGDAMLGLGKIEAARDHIQTSLDVRKAIYGDEHHDLAKSYYSLANVYAANGETEIALQYMQMALDIRNSTYGPRHLLTKQTKSNFSRLLAQLH